MEMANLIAQWVIAVGAILAVATYFWKKRAEKRDAAIMVVMQIMDILAKVEKVRKCFNKKGLDWQAFYEMRPIIVKNLWDEYKHLFIATIDRLSYQEIENFYSSAEAIERKRIDGHQVLFTHFNFLPSVFNQSKVRMLELYLSSQLPANNNGMTKEQFIELNNSFTRIFDGVPEIFKTDVPEQISETLKKIVKENEKINVVGCKGFHKLQELAKI